MLIDKIDTKNWHLPSINSFHTSKKPPVFLCGLFEYYCLATSQVAFHDGARLRRGLAIFLPRPTSRGLKIAVKGIRLASAVSEFTEGEAAFVSWNGCGMLVDDEGQLQLSYKITNDGEKGTTEDRFTFFAAEGLPPVISGTFTQALHKGSVPTTGEVMYSKLTTPERLESFVSKYVEGSNTGKIRRTLAEEDLAPSADIVLAEIRNQNPPNALDRIALLDFVSGCCVYSQQESSLSTLKRHFDPRLSILYQERLHELPATLYARHSNLQP